MKPYFHAVATAMPQGLSHNLPRFGLIQSRLCPSPSAPKRTTQLIILVKIVTMLLESNVPDSATRQPKCVPLKANCHNRRVPHRPNRGYSGRHRRHSAHLEPTGTAGWTGKGTLRRRYVQPYSAPLRPDERADELWARHVCGGALRSDRQCLVPGTLPSMWPLARAA